MLDDEYTVNDLHDKAESVFKAEDYGQDNGEWYDIDCCEKHVHKEYEVYAPVSVKPYVHEYKPEAKCEGEAHVEPGCKHCKDGCKEFEFTIMQKISVDVPVKYGVVVRYHKPCVEEE